MRKPGKQEKSNLHFSCFPAFLICLCLDVVSIRLNRYENGLRGACEFYTHTRHTRSIPPFPPSELIGGLGDRPKERGSLAFSHCAAPLRPPLQLARGV